MSVPAEIRDAVEAAVGPLSRIASVSGGDVAQAVCAATPAGPVFIKWKPSGPRDLFVKEADGLRRLAESGALRVPETIATGDDPPFLVLAYLAVAPPVDPRRFRVRFAEGLARLHSENVAPDGAYGLDTDNYLGSQPQKNEPLHDWGVFYRDRRLAPQIARARVARLLPPGRESALACVLARTETILAALPGRPVLIHGDLWSGNFLCVDNEPVLIDPAVYYAEREVEIAYVELFGGFPSGFVDTYRDILPLADGYEERRPLHQLYPLLIHLNHFGETYGPAVDRACAALLPPRE